MGSPEDVQNSRPECVKTVDPEFDGLFPRDYLFLLDLPFDPDSQLRAIHSILMRHRTAEAELVAEIEVQDQYARKLRGIWNDRAVEDWVELVHSSAYHDAAHSMAAVGMLAPFIESIFAHCFTAIGDKCFSGDARVSGHERWKQGSNREWDCHFVFRNEKFQKDLLCGVGQLAEETGLQRYLTVEVWPRLHALYSYRNKMFHNGFEWPLRERKAFELLWNRENWPKSWFSRATSGSEPWIFYMTNEFIDLCMQAGELIIDGFGKLVKKDLRYLMKMD